MDRILLRSVPSTNDYALAMLERGRPTEGTVIQALEQTHGRGMGGTRWSSERGKNLIVSIVLYPTFLLPRLQFRLAQAVALAVRDCVAEAAPDGISRIKWPNDVLLEDRKTAGILVENRITASRMVASVVGIGINVNQTMFPPGIEGAFSLALATGKEHDLEAVLGTLTRLVGARYEQLRKDPQQVDTGYHANLHGLGRMLPYRTMEGEARGTITGVDQEGRLHVQRADGSDHVYGFKEVTFGAA
jgi:BirA family biotin operon repressor/biotin-[acetyl-CoA-carboxylase] ligase